MSREAWIDSAKGVAISLVVLGHAIRGIQNSEIVPAGVWDLGDLRIYAFHKPLFFALSGWFYLRSISKRPFAGYVIFYPMVIWTYIFLAFKLVAGQYANEPIGLQDILVLPIPGVQHFWFLWDLLLVSLAFFPLRYLIRAGAPSWAVWALVILGIGALQFLPLSEEVNYWIGSAVRNTPYFLLGILLGHLGATRHASNKAGPVALIVFGALLYVWPSFALSEYRMLGSLVLVTCFLFASAWIVPLLPKITQSWLATLGMASMAIYVMHTIFSAVVREGLQALDMNDPIVHLVAGTLIGLLAPVILLGVFRRFGMTRILGLEGRG